MLSQGGPCGHPVVGKLCWLFGFSFLLCPWQAGYFSPFFSFCILCFSPAKQWFVQYLTTDFHCKFPALEKATRRNGGTKRSWCFQQEGGFRPSLGQIHPPTKSINANMSQEVNKLESRHTDALVLLHSITYITCRHEICQKFYTSQFLGKRILHRKNA